MQRQFRYFLFDAFTTTALSGNPCAVVFDADALTSEEMLKLAKEMNQSETAFLLKSKKYDLKARYFTPEREIPLAGHPTIALVSAAMQAGLISKTKLQLELQDGPIPIEVDFDTNLVRMFQRKPIFAEVHDPRVVLPLFGLDESDLLNGANIQTVSTGTRQLMVPLQSQASLRRLSMKIEAYKDYRAKMNFFSPHLFCLEGIHPDAITFARHLGVAPDTMEDAFTGSATGAMAAYVWKYGFLKNANFIAEQGHWMGRPGRAYVEVLGPRENIESVVIAGNAVCVVEGSLFL